MMMGGMALVACLLPLIAVGMLVVAVVNALQGNSNLLEQLLPPGIPTIRATTDPQPRQEREQQSDYVPLGTNRMEQTDTAQRLDYVRPCHECGTDLHRKWPHCPSCGAKLYWQ